MILRQWRGITSSLNVVMISLFVCGTLPVFMQLHVSIIGHFLRLFVSIIHSLQLYFEGFNICHLYHEVLSSYFDGLNKVKVGFQT
jgi:hypothetical protein